ncbi:hypothetical protein AVEN_152955-1 [Araneus ventricosus]|uniref:Uncharacterized protein n=1 Tax=Araneus ventricosus TaxID=182803 RepID=A0A4Y2AD35_ARAVE|nr:hypothetical protein AVEN_152955-1 [Araneus ventricosus]
MVEREIELEEKRMQFETAKSREESQAVLSSNLPTREESIPNREAVLSRCKFEMKEDISLYLVLFQRQASQVLAKEKSWVTHLFNLPEYVNAHLKYHDY